MSKECECPVDHTITKLGHCRTCPFYTPPPPIRILPGYLLTTSVFSCPPVPIGHVHDFGWATYSDELESYGVCSCGYDSYQDALWTLP